LTLKEDILGTAKNVGITAMGSYFPPGIVTNDDLSRMMDTNDSWIRSRTGIHQRHWVEPGAGASDIALPAVRQCLERRGIEAGDIDVIIVGTVTPDTLFPSTACRIQTAIGATHAWGFDLSAACSSLLYALITGKNLVSAGQARRCLVVGVDVMSAIINKEDRTTAVLFGDGAGCVLLEEVEQGGIIDAVLRIDGAGGDNLHMPAGGSRRPASAETVANKEHFVHQNGREVFKTAVTEMANVSLEILQKHGLGGEHLSLFVPHQANIRIIESAAKRMKLPWEKVMINIDRRANTTSATLPTCLDEAVEKGRLVKGDRVLLATFGAGYTWGAALLEWSL
jgi:3-oxoacyl-[acyl-carrier-protein] synthase-3